MTNANAHNSAKFEALKKHNLPADQYAITGSGPLGIRNLREIGDIDIIVTQKLWDELAEKYGVTVTDAVNKIVFAGDNIEAFRNYHQGPLNAEQKFHDAPSIAERIAAAEIIDGLPFESLKHFLYYKRKMARDKDLKDVLAIETWLKNKPR